MSSLPWLMLATLVTCGGQVVVDDGGSVATTASGAGASGSGGAPTTSSAAYASGVGALYDDYPGECALGCGEYLAGYAPFDEVCGEHGALFEALSQCVCAAFCASACPVSCGSNPAGDDTPCDACVDASCAGELSACNADI